MSRLYRVDIELTLDIPFNQTTKKDEEYVKYDVLPYLCVANLATGDPDELRREIAEDYDPFEIDRCYSSITKGKQRTAVHCSRQTSFRLGYGEKDYHEDVLKHIERFKKELPWAFDVEIQLHYLEHDPALVVSASNIEGGV